MQQNKLPDDRIYYNVVINNNNIDSNTLIPCTFSANLSLPIMQNPSEYYMAITRFSIPGLSLPLFVCPIQSEQNDPLLTPFAVVLSYEGVDYEEYVSYIPENTYTQPPAPGAQADGQQIQSNYYYIYSVQNFLNMVNNALAEAFLALITEQPSAPVTEAPYFSFDSTTQLISLTCQRDFISSESDPVLIYINTSLYKYFDGFQYIYNPVNNDNKDYQFVISDTGNNSYTPPGDTVVTPSDYLRTPQQYQCMYNWIGMQGILVTTSLLPVVGEWIPGPISSSNGQNTNQLKLITDFQPSFTTLADCRSIFQYSQQGPYRAINLASDRPLTQVDLNVYFQDRLNNLYQVFIPPGFSFNMKIIFIKKDTFYS